MLPDADTYELQIVEIVQRPQQPPHPDNKDKSLKDEVALILELVGTKNPEQDDKPFKVWVFPFRDGTQLAYTDRTGKSKFSKGGYVLSGLGYDYKAIESSSYSELNYDALNGLFLRGPVVPNGQYLKCDPKALMPVKNPEHQKVNKAREADVFTASVLS